MLASDFFQLPESIPFAESFSPDARPWEWLPKIKEALSGLKGNASEKELPSGVRIEGEVFISDGVKLPAFASMKGPCWIGEDVEIRPGAYIRGNVIIGAGSVIGNSCEYKNALLMERTHTPHFSYVGQRLLQAYGFGHARSISQKWRSTFPYRKELLSLQCHRPNGRTDCVSRPQS